MKGVNRQCVFLRSLEIIAWSTLIFGLLLYFADKVFLRVKKIDDLNLISGSIIGFLTGFCPPGYSTVDYQGEQQSIQIHHSAYIMLAVFITASSMSKKKIDFQSIYDRNSGNTRDSFLGDVSIDLNYLLL